jgi:hypothetical protein
MKKRLPFGPGRPDYDANLDLFDALEDPPASEGPPDNIEGWPADITLRFPCSSCLDNDPISLEDPLTISASAGKCPLSGKPCTSDNPTQQHYRKAEGLWQIGSGHNLKLIKADSWERAVRKEGGKPDNPACSVALKVRPFYATHGGYADNG